MPDSAPTPEIPATPRGDATDEVIQGLDLSSLTPEQLQKARHEREVLYGFLLGLRDAQKVLLLSRQRSQDPETGTWGPGLQYPWQQTGFLVDTKTGTVNAKVGQHQYQPIGYDDGTHLVTIKGHQVLWRREFAYAPLEPVESPFDIVDTGGADRSDDTALSARERPLMTEAVQDLTQALQEHKSATLAWGERATAHQGPEPFGERHPDYKLRDDLTVHCMRLQRLFLYLVRNQEEFERKTGRDLWELSIANHTVDGIVRAMTEWMDMKLQDDSIRLQVEQTSMDAPQGRPNPLDKLLLERLERAETDEAIQAVLSTAYSYKLTLRPYLDEVEASSMEKPLREVRDHVIDVLRGGSAQDTVAT